MTTRPTLPECRAMVVHPPHNLYSNRCVNRARHERDGRPVCGIHAKAYDRNPAACAYVWGWR